jgi:hypothetical protein
MSDYIQINESYPPESCEVDVLLNGEIARSCLFHKGKFDEMFPNGFFANYYGLILENVTHWKIKQPTQ